MQDSRTLHYVLGAALVMVAVFTVGSLVMLNSQASSSSSVAITNTAPVVVTNSIFANATVGTESDGTNYTSNTAGQGIDVLVAGVGGHLYISGLVHDDNGGADIANNTVDAVTLVFYETPNQTSACAVDTTDCYTVLFSTTTQAGNCKLGAASGALEYHYSCDVNLAQFAESTTLLGAYSGGTWAAAVKVKDAGGLNTISTKSTFEMKNTGGLIIPGTIAYGTLGLGVSTTNLTNNDMVLTQNGNIAMDVQVQDVGAPSGLTCTIGTIASSGQHYAITDANYGVGVVGAPDYENPLSTTLTGNILVNVPVRTHGIATPTQKLYWGVAIPATGVGGSCTGATLVSAVAH